ncbi:ABC-F type ribosomal protection protein [Jeotgalicoccus coquinae]|uniref:Pleuromutilin/lincosamide/streptogramin A transport system ATP-binding/permease protein n=1 Tax=Jeotgalicoccus coquinae TaxID=709509 RepID=A0A6V7RRF3_9STAP|nr:ATP-binding cassette domain-containing protein [Jeotgalicoccus coquinae]MBB6423318.1 pleuromutilin/lincosamide/streptogramin A transport system ATP-binding/permease protein [Jeotgalicoccus coquinae]GGE09016.1 ABC-F type ribosomal protection protein [Jeotgalicoccus coquinae]CAD2081749.1 putative ABC transporter ATP-binding protein YheS [Jeotgalicoccus coquinae]
MMNLNDITLEINGETIISIDNNTVQEHKTIGLIGRNGSGKTTLLKHIINNDTLYTNQRITYIPQLKNNDMGKSGGETTKVYLQQGLKNSGGILLLDEPTTHLDETNAAWLLNELNKKKAIKIIASHDRDFLDQIAEEIWAVEDTKIAVYPGNYSHYKEIEAHNRQREKDEYDKYIREKQHLEKAVENKSKQAALSNKPKNKTDSDFRQKGAKPYFNKLQKKLDQVASGMESRLNQLEEKEKPEEEKQVIFYSHDVEKLGSKTVIRLEHEDIAREEKMLLKDVSLYLKATDKVSITGTNGSGKTTLLNYIYNKYRNSNLAIGYFYQQLESLDLNLSILENITKSSSYDETTVRTALARLNIKADEVHKKVSVISGGERVKVQLVKLLMANSQVLILDEPTNFLDVHSIEALEEMLKNYPGLIILVSHDKRFRERITPVSYDIQNRKLVNPDIPVPRNAEKDELMVLETQITRVLSELSAESTPELEEEFERLIKQKNDINNQ